MLNQVKTQRKVQYRGYIALYLDRNSGKSRYYFSFNLSTGTYILWAPMLQSHSLPSTGSTIVQLNILKKYTFVLNTRKVRYYFSFKLSTGTYIIWMQRLQSQSAFDLKYNCTVEIFEKAYLCTKFSPAFNKVVVGANVFKFCMAHS